MLPDRLAAKHKTEKTFGTPSPWGPAQLVQAIFWSTQDAEGVPMKTPSSPLWPPYLICAALEVCQHVLVVALELADARETPPPIPLRVSRVPQLPSWSQADGDLGEARPCSSEGGHQVSAGLSQGTGGTGPLSSNSCRRRPRSWGGTSRRGLHNELQPSRCSGTSSACRPASLQR